MPIHLSKATKHALALVAGGMTRYAAAKESGVALSTIYRAVKRQQEQTEKPDYAKIVSSYPPKQEQTK